MKVPLLIFALISISRGRILPSGAIKLSKIRTKSEPKGDFAIFERNLRDLSSDSPSSGLMKVVRLAESIKQEMQSKNAEIKSIKIGSNVGRKLGVQNIAKVLEVALNSKDSPQDFDGANGSRFQALPRKTPPGDELKVGMNMASYMGDVSKMNAQAKKMMKANLQMDLKEAENQTNAMKAQSENMLKYVKKNQDFYKEQMKASYLAEEKAQAEASIKLKMQHDALRERQRANELAQKNAQAQASSSLKEPSENSSASPKPQSLNANPNQSQIPKAAPMRAPVKKNQQSSVGASSNSAPMGSETGKKDPELLKANLGLQTVLRNYPYVPFIQDGPYYHAPMELQINTMPNPNPRTAMSPLSIEQLNLSHQANFLSEFAKKANDVFVGKASRFQNDLDLDSFKQLSTVQNLLH